MTGEVLALLLVPIAGIAATSVTRGLMRSVVGLAAAAGTAVASLRLAATLLADNAAAGLGLRGPAGVEVALVVDGLAASMLVMTAVVVLAVAAFAVAEDRRDAAARHVAYWPLLFALWGSLNLLFLAGDLFTAYLTLEVIALCGALLVTLRGDRKSLLAGTRYLYAELAASTTMLLGVALVWSQAGTVAFDGLGRALGDAPLGQVGLAIMTAGLLVKVPLAPLHFWLPAAHTQAPDAVSPVLSAVVVKAGFAVVARLWFLAVPDLVTVRATQLLAILGTVAVLWGSIAALRASALKRLVAASTVAQLGLLFLLPPLVAAGAVDGWRGGVVLAVAHAFAKAALLMAAAVLGDEASGSAARRPVATMAFAIAGLSLVGLPPTGGFVAKWYLLLGSVATGQWAWATLLVAATLLTVAYLMRHLRPAFSPLPDGAPAASHRDARDVIALVLAGTTVLMGLVPGPLLDLIEIGAPLGGG